MKKIFLILLLTIFFSLTASSVAAQSFPYEEYTSRTLSELTELNAGAVTELKGEKQMLVSSNPLYSRIRLKYVGASRPISADRMAMLKIWNESLGLKSNGKDIDLTAILEKEFLFTECGREYWLPVQKQVSAFFPKELKEGQMVTLYLMVAGGYKFTDKWDYVFVVSEFQT